MRPTAPLSLLTRPLAALAVLATLLASTASTARAGDRTLFDFENVNLSSIEKHDVWLFHASNMNGRNVRMVMGLSSWPGITLKPQGAPSWDLRSYDWISVDLRNSGFWNADMCVRIDMAGGDGSRNSVTEGVKVLAHSSTTLKVWFKRQAPAGFPVGALFAMRGLPGGFLPDAATVDTRAITQITVFANKPGAVHIIDVDDVRAGGSFDYPTWADPLPSGGFPFIDRYGQLIHKSWPGKVRADADLAAARTAEEADLTAHPVQPQRDRFGGWATGPHLAATGRFHTQKIMGKWSIVDPDGNLFFSLGLDCVGGNEPGPITDRERLFAEIPAPGSPLAYRWWDGPAPNGYYSTKSYENMDFAAANLHRKFGAGWQPIVRDEIHRRLKSWGLNTIGAWSWGDLFADHRTPYTVSIGNSARHMDGGFPDVFDPAFESSLRTRMQAEVGRSASDPWCLGYFVDNEIPFTWDDWGLALAALRSPRDQPAKVAFVNDLKATYRNDIGRLNRSWKTSHASWDALLASTTPPDRKKAEDDLSAFGKKIADVYFATCRAAVKASAPDGLYLGCRFEDRSPAARAAAARCCDIVSINHYARDAASLSLEGIDAPIIIGEFHFGALDRGPFHATGLPTSSQAERAASYARYVDTALRNPQVVGAHWFQYRDQPAAGRFDGENAQIGFIDICDQPYPEIVAAARGVTERMYTRRFIP